MVRSVHGPSRGQLVDGVPQASCMAELGTKLGSLFLAELVVKNGTEIFIP